MKLLTCMVIVLITVAYVTVGGIVFHLLEFDNETSVRGNASEFYIRFLGIRRRCSFYIKYYSLW